MSWNKPTYGVMTSMLTSRIEYQDANVFPEDFISIETSERRKRYMNAPANACDNRYVISMR